ncbi:MAG: D-glycero-alpha-D-manno-heptose-1,7-bisphosphate 7-phosphatase [Balneolaceae bacterium]
MAHKAFFLDRDGTLNIDYNFVHRPDEWDWCDGAVEALRWIHGNGFKIVVVTNQSGIARGRYTEEDVQQLHRWVDKQLSPIGISIDRWLMAAHHPNHDPELRYPPEDRKPGTGMFLKAAEELDIDFQSSFMAGDKLSDLKPAVELGITPFFIQSRHEKNQDKEWLHRHQIPIHRTLWEAIQTHLIST